MYENKTCVIFFFDIQKDCKTYPVLRLIKYIHKIYTLKIMFTNKNQSMSSWLFTLISQSCMDLIGKQ